MSEKKNYPEEIYETRDGLTMTIKQRDGHGGRARRRAFDLGYEQGRLDGGQEHLEPGALWTRLNRSHPAWGRIDWVALYKRPATLIHSTSMSVIATEVASKGPYSVSYDDGPRETPAHQALLLKALPTMTHSSLHGATQAALEDRDGWALYVLGQLPLRKLTADELAPGTCFRGKHPDVHDGAALNCIVVEQPNSMPKMVIYTNPITNQRASEVEVVEVYGVGTFQTPKENQK
ncbi:hypothetical protein [Rothia nasimurium]|uniref:hypothetical protein n=1 Tax=Rothia nasimurium TaxID=85336 RepID=UPI001F1EA6B4|nr:hypothetical protein [Rothia nasimurium]